MAIVESLWESRYDGRKLRIGGDGLNTDSRRCLFLFEARTPLRFPLRIAVGVVAEAGLIKFALDLAIVVASFSFRQELLRNGLLPLAFLLECAKE
jgi:hypothetical protein